MRVTILSDSPFLPTGYSNQAKQLAIYLRSKGHEVDWLANGYSGATVKHAKLQDGTIFDFPIRGGLVQDYFKNVISNHLKKNKTDIFFILLDTFMLFGTDGWFLNIDCSPAKTIFWFPSDGGGGMPKHCERILMKVEQPVAMARFGQKQVKDYYNLNVKHIPHGVDKNRFYRLPDEERIALRKKWGLNDKFVIGVVARNQPRKNLDRTIKAMKLVAEKIPNAMLLLHLDPKDPAPQAFQISELIKKFEIENRVVFTGMSAHDGFDWDEMNNVYNLMDVFFLSTSGEGFGIPIIEAMSCEVPVVVTDYTTTQELVIDNKAGLGIKLSGTEYVDMFETDSKDYDKLKMNGTMTGSWEVERGYCDIKDAAEQITWLYEHPLDAGEMGQNGRQAVLEKYDFEIVAKQWEDLMNDLSG